MSETATKPAPSPRVGAYTMDPNEVQIGTNNGPGLYLAPVGTAGPADTVTPWPAGWDILGYLSADGPKIGQTTNTNEIIPWQSMVPLRTVITSRAITLNFIMWQINERTLALYFDSPVPTATAGAFVLPVSSSGDQQLYAVGVDAADGDECMRILFGRASLSAVSDMPIKRGEAVPLDVTLSALDDSGTLATILVGPTA